MQPPASSARTRALQQTRQATRQEPRTLEVEKTGPFPKTWPSYQAIPTRGRGQPVARWRAGEPRRAPTWPRRRERHRDRAGNRTAARPRTGLPPLSARVKWRGRATTFAALFAPGWLPPATANRVEARPLQRGASGAFLTAPRENWRSPAVKGSSVWLRLYGTLPNSSALTGAAASRSQLPAASTRRP